jgi:hypothetical protein
MDFLTEIKTMNAIDHYEYMIYITFKNEGRSNIEFVPNSVEFFKKCHAIVKMTLSDLNTEKQNIINACRLDNISQCVPVFGDNHLGSLKASRLNYLMHKTTTEGGKVENKH